MADQRRYKSTPEGYTEEQYLSTIRSGEGPDPNMPWYSRALRNAGAAIPRLGTGMTSTLAMGKAAIEAGLDENLDFKEALLGKGTQEKMNAYVKSNADQLFYGLPEEMRKGDRGIANYNRIVAQIQGSRAHEEELYRISDTPYVRQLRDTDQINEMFGLPPAKQETIVDDAEQALATAIIPSGKLKIVGKGAPWALRGAARAAELMLPGGTGSVASTLGNAAVDLGMSQGMRAWNEDPGLWMGNATLGEELANKKAQQQQPATQQAIVSQGKGARLPSNVDPTVTNSIDPADDDDDGGFVGKNWLIGVGAAGVLATTLMAFRGRSPHGVIDLTTNEHLTAPGVARGTVTPENLLNQPGTMPMSKGDKAFTEFIDDTHPMKKSADQAVRNLTADQQAQAAENLAMLKYRASHQDVQADVNRWMHSGEMPGVSTRLPSFEDIDTATRRLSDQERELYMKGMQLKHLNNRYAQALQSLDDKVTDLRVKAARGQVSWAQYHAENARLTQMRDPQFQMQPGMSVREARSLMAQFDANPKLRGIESQYRRITNGVLEGINRQGLMDPVSIQNLMRTGPHYVHQVEDAMQGATGFQRMMKYAGLQMGGRNQTKMWHSVRPVIRSTGEATDSALSHIENPLDPNAALHAYVKDYIEYTRHNDATKYYMKMMSNSPDWGMVARRAHDPITITDFNKQAGRRGTAIESLLADKRTVGYAENGMIHLFQVHDPAIAQGLQFNPASALPFFDWARRVGQRTFTTYNPAFALTKAPAMDLFQMWANRKPGQVFGYLDMWNRKMFPNGNVITELFDKFPDPTIIPHAFWVGSIGASRELLHLASKKVANDLKFDSGFFHQLAQIPGMEDVLDNIAQAGIRQYKDSWYALADHYGIKGHVYTPVHMESLSANYNSYMKTGKFPQGVRGAAQAYMTVLDNMRNSVKTAQFFQQLAVEGTKHPNGIPKKLMNKIVTENKKSTGDMSLKPKNEYVGAAESFFGYANVTANSIALLGQSIKRAPFTIGARVMSGMVAPTVFMSWLMAQNKDTYEWYFNTLPTFERVSNFPAIKPEWFVKAATGNAKLTPDDIMLIPMSQEMAVVTSVFNTMMRAAGFYEGSIGIGPHTGYQPGDPRMHMSDARAQMPWKEIGTAITNMLPFQTNPIIELATGKKINFGNILTGKEVVTADKEDKSLGLSAPHGFTASLTDGMISLLGGVGDIVEMAATPWSMKTITDGNVLKAISDTFSWAGYGVERKMSDVLGTGASIWTGGQRRRYATTPPRERVNAAKQVAEKLLAQRSAANLNKRTKDYHLPTIDPKTVQMNNEILSYMTANRMISLNKKRGTINKRIENLDYNRAKYRPEEYHRMNNQLYIELHGVDEQQDAIVTQLENNLRRKYDMDLDQAYAYIQDNLLE